MSIDIEVARPFRDKVSIARLSAAVTTSLAHENAIGDVTVAIVDDATIADLNSRYLDGEGPTDVLSFPAQSPDDFVQPPGADPYLGDIVIAYPFAARQAHARDADVVSELDLLVVHGVLHLLGYDHAEAIEEERMWARQASILRRLEEVLS